MIRLDADLEAAYREMASDEARETEASALSEGLIGDVADLTGVERAIRIQLDL